MVAVGPNGTTKDGVFRPRFQGTEVSSKASTISEAELSARYPTGMTKKEYLAWEANTVANTVGSTNTAIASSVAATTHYPFSQEPKSMTEAFVVPSFEATQSQNNQVSHQGMYMGRAGDSGTFMSQASIADDHQWTQPSAISTTPQHQAASYYPLDEPFGFLPSQFKHLSVGSEVPSSFFPVPTSVNAAPQPQPIYAPALWPSPAPVPPPWTLGMSGHPAPPQGFPILPPNAGAMPIYSVSQNRVGGHSAPLQGFPALPPNAGTMPIYSIDQNGRFFEVNGQPPSLQHHVHQFSMKSLAPQQTNASQHNPAVFSYDTPSVMAPCDRFSTHSFMTQESHPSPLDERSADPAMTGGTTRQLPRRDQDRPLQSWRYTLQMNLPMSDQSPQKYDICLDTVTFIGPVSWTRAICADCSIFLAPYFNGSALGKGILSWKAAKGIMNKFRRQNRHLFWPAGYHTGGDNYTEAENLLYRLEYLDALQMTQNHCPHATKLLKISRREDTWFERMSKDDEDDANNAIDALRRKTVRRLLDCLQAVLGRDTTWTGYTSKELWTLELEPEIKDVEYRPRAGSTGEGSEHQMTDDEDYQSPGPARTQKRDPRNATVMEEEETSSESEDEEEAMQRTAERKDAQETRGRRY